MANNQYWDEVLFPLFRATIRGEIYATISIDEMDEECYNLACRAIAAFKFPKISTEYTTFYAARDEDTNEIVECSASDEGAIPHGEFINELTHAELEVIVAFMKVYWYEANISNTDNFEDIYTDSNIKTYSRANLIDKNLKALQYAKNSARELETTYSRINNLKKPSLGDINEDD